MKLPAIVSPIDHCRFMDCDLMQMFGQVEVDNDNLPAPESVPIADTEDVNDVFIE